MILTQLLSSSPLTLGSLPDAGAGGLYVHIPFCFHKCHYCDFYSITGQTAERMDRFVDRILAEAGMWAKSQQGKRSALRSIFFGGGTPSLLPIQDMRRLIDGLRSQFDLSSVKEWTVEVNPATTSLEYCCMLRESGVDRLSFGAQSFDPAELSILERHHDPDDVFRSIELARKAGFLRLNVDLIYAIPGQDVSAWSRSLESAIALDIPHLSCYGLTYEPNTPMTVKRRMGVITAVDEEVELEMFRHTRRRLAAAGLPAYEISNYAKPGDACRHNLLYWSGGNYIGLGPSAASHIEGHRFRNRPHLQEWESAIDAGDLPATDLEILTAKRRAGELAMLLLRLMRPISFADFAAQSGFDARELFADPLNRYSATGLLDLTDNEFHVTERGLELVDSIASEFLSICQ